MKYLFTVDFMGTPYSGWQVQPGERTVQGVLEEKMSMLLRAPISIIGCGRTDAGVHARDYAFSAELQPGDEKDFLYHLNAVLPADIAVKEMEPKPGDFHARFDALSRSYVYHIHGKKDPFLTGTSWYLKGYEKLDFDRMREASLLISKYENFYPFCKSGHDAKTYRCVIMDSRLVIDAASSTISYHIKANRFLRGMVRLITGMLVQVGLGQVSIEEVSEALERQKRIAKPLSAPAHGLFFSGAKYPND